MNEDVKKNLKNMGFTLIELLAVIIILGVLMIIAVPSVTEYISGSRKNAYIITARQYISDVRNKVNEADYPFFDLNSTYYVPLHCVTLERGGNSPFGEWKDAYVVVAYTGDSYKYYFTGYDSANMGIVITSENNLDSDIITPGISSVNTLVGVGNRSNVVLLDDSCDASRSTSQAATAQVSENVKNGEGMSSSDSNPGGSSQTGDSLASLVSVGDFVNYDAGNWDTTVNKPTSSDILAFGGYTAGNSRNASIACYDSYENPPTSPMKNGWRVLKVDGDVVTLIHAGNGECFEIYDGPYVWGIVYNAESVLGKNPSGTVASGYSSTPHDFSYYMNSYASSVSIFDKSLLDEYLGYNITYGMSFNDDLIKTGVYYWLGTAYNESNLWYVEYSGVIGNARANVRGIRPVVTLKSGVRTTGKGTDSFGNSAWILK